MQAAVPTRSAKKPRTTVKTRGVMFTYNHDFLANGVETTAVMTEFHDFVGVMKGTLSFSRFSATMELSLRTNRTVTLAEVFGDDSVPDEDQQRVHLHLFVDWAEDQELTPASLCEQMQFMTAKPHMNISAAKGRGQERSLHRSHFYVRAEKVGSLHFFGNFFPWKEWADGGVGNYRVEGKWIDDLWSEHKLSDEIYLQYAELIRVEFPKRRTWHDAIVSQLHTRKLHAEVARRDAVLRQQFHSWKDFAAVAAWKQSHTEMKSRYDILVLRQ